jgi:hypothetical protein
MTAILCKGIHVMEVKRRRYLVLVVDEANDAGRLAWFELTMARKARSDHPGGEVAPSSLNVLAARSATSV